MRGMSITILIFAWIITLNGNMGVFKLYRKSENAVSISLAVDVGTYIFIGYVFSFGVLSDKPLVAIIGSYDGEDNTQHKSINKLHDNDLLNLEINVTTNGTHKMTVSLAYKDGFSKYMHISLLKIDSI